MPRWSPRGGQLFYVAPWDKMMAVAVETVPRLSARGAQLLFEKPYFGWADRHTYDVAPDGKRFLVVKPAVGDVREHSELRLVLNWSEELKAKVATR